MLDHHVHAAIHRGLRTQGVDVISAAEDGSDRLPDDELLQRALELDRVLFSQDVDLLTIADQWISAKPEFAGLAYGRQMGVTIGQAIRDLQLMALVLSPHEIRNSVVYLPL